MDEDELVVDSFAGGGGASLGIEMAIGRSPDVAIDHDHEAIAMHEANHTGTLHLHGDVWECSSNARTGDEMDKQGDRTMNKAIKMARQGDVLFLRSEAGPPTEATPAMREPDGAVVLARGSSSSHQHVARGALRAFDAGDGTLHLDAAEDVTVTVEGPASPESDPRHGPVVLAAGQWTVRYPMEWSAERANKVAD